MQEHEAPSVLHIVLCDSFSLEPGSIAACVGTLIRHDLEAGLS